jgi:uncharacterized protein YkvS
VGHLAWPVFAVGVLAFIYRKASSITRLVQSIKYRDVEIVIREEFAEAREETEAIRANSTSQAAITAQGTPEPDDKILRLARIDPAVAIMETFRSLEAEITRIIQHHGYMRWVAPKSFMDHLAKSNLISQKEHDLFMRLRNIRNEAIHAQASVTLAEVIEYKDFVTSFVERLKSIPNPLANFPLPKPRNDAW